MTNLTERVAILSAFETIIAGTGDALNRLGWPDPTATNHTEIKKKDDAVVAGIWSAWKAAIDMLQCMQHDSP